MSNIILAGHRPFATGSKRSCYVHPHNRNLCIKVPSNTCDERDGIAAQQLELDDYSALQRCGCPALFDRIPRFEGTVKTDLGLGIVSQLLRDVDGEISQNLAVLVEKQGLTDELSESINELKQWLHDQQLVTRDTGPHNIVAMRVASLKWHLVIIEGWVNRKFSWLTRSFHSFGGYLLTRQLRKFDRRMSYLVTIRQGGRAL